MTLVSSVFKPTLLTTKQVVLYNFFEDSTATPNQWRLVLNEISNGDDLPDVPTFDETRHASICVEVCCLLSKHFFLRPPPLTISGFAVEILVRCNYSRSEQPLDCGRFPVS
jgi:hypothetical protein